MTLDARAPVIVGAGQVRHHDVCEEESGEPVVLIAEALRRAGEDSGRGERLLRDADSARCVPVIGWPYRDVAALLAEDLGARPRDTAQSALIGGDGPQLLLNDTARAIAADDRTGWHVTIGADQRLTLNRPTSPTRQPADPSASTGSAAGGRGIRCSHPLPGRFP